MLYIYIYVYLMYIYLFCQTHQAKYAQISNLNIYRLQDMQHFANRDDAVASGSMWLLD